ncbi:MAG: hypothetical protein EXR79_01920 [Myxococcales bacterium]|nr:hypothetical protein [Myxococcales bacterium]
MHSANGHYSHRHVLNRYAQVADATPLPGLLQHGWNPDAGAVPADVLIPAPDPFYCWSARNLANCHASQFASVTVCLYWFDAQSEVNRIAFARHGFEVTSVGHRVQGDATP